MKTSILKTIAQPRARLAQFLGIIGVVFFGTLNSFYQSELLLALLSISFACIIMGFLIAKLDDVDDSSEAHAFRKDERDFDRRVKMITRARKNNPRFFELLHEKYKGDILNSRFLELNGKAIEKYGKHHWWSF